MTPEQQAKETAEFLAAYRESKHSIVRDVLEWRSQHFDQAERLVYDNAHGWVIECWSARVGWRTARGCSDHEAAALILYAFHPQLDEAKAEVKQDHAAGYWWCSQGTKTLTAGSFENAGTLTAFDSRPLATLAAIQALEAEAHG
jgi:hypothetical protein